MILDFKNFNRSELIKEWAFSKKEISFLLFYAGHNNPGIGPHVFSQWYMSPFSDSMGTTYTCAEQFMMAHKALLFGDSETHQKIMNAEEPQLHKKLGRQVKNFDKKIWYQEARRIVLEASWYKFISRPDLEGYLLSTEDEVLVEASPVDRIWGIGLSSTHPNCVDPVLWNGLNWLGFSLMVARTCIIHKMAPTTNCVGKAQEHYGVQCKTCSGVVE